MRDPKDIARPIVDIESGKLQGFRLSREGARKNAINRRAFLRGAGTVAIGLPFLEGLPERSAWAAGSPPVFTMFIVGSCGVVGESFLPDATGALTTSGLAGMTTKAVSALSAHAPNLTMLKQIADKVGADVSQDPTLAVLEKATQPEKLVEQIERTIDTAEQQTPPKS